MAYAARSIDSGIPEQQPMLISGYPSRAMSDRYDVTNERDIQIAGQKLERDIQQKGEKLQNFFREIFRLQSVRHPRHR